MNIIARLNPNHVFNYVCVDEREVSEKTIFFLKPLTVYDYKYCEEVNSDGLNLKFGNFSFNILEKGLVGWKNFYYEDNASIPFSIKNFSTVPQNIQAELTQELIRLSDVDEKLTDELIFVAKWSNYVSNLKGKDTWNCDECMEKKQDRARNCCNKYPEVGFKKTIGKTPGDTVTSCPISMLTSRAVKLTNIINYINDSKSLPFVGGSLEQTNFFYSARMIVLSERNSMLRQELDNQA